MRAKMKFLSATPKTLAALVAIMLMFSGKVALNSQAVDFDNEIQETTTVEADTFSSEFNIVETEVNQTTGRCTPAVDPVKLTWFYKPPGDMTKMLANYDFMVLIKNDENQMRQAKSSGKYPVLQYIRFDSIHDPCGQVFKAKGTPCSCSSSPWNSTVGWNKNDICDIRDNHPDWFLRDSSGKIIVINKMVVMDPGNAGWRNFWLSRLKQSQPDGWHGIFMDNMGTKFNSHGYGERSLQKYPTLESYQNAVYNFLSKVRADYFAPNKRLMFGNISVHWGHTPYYLKLMTQLDGSMDEHWAGTKSGYYSVKSWEDRVLRARESIRQGNIVMLITQGSQSDYNRQRFSLASYLLVVSDNAYFRYTHQDYAYGQIWLYDNYKARLGKPLGDYTRSGNTWTRNFANGKVTVNPETRSSSITVCKASGC